MVNEEILNSSHASFFVGVIIRKKSRSAVSGAGSSKDADADADEGYVINHEHLHNYPPTYTQVLIKKI